MSLRHKDKEDKYWSRWARNLSKKQWGKNNEYQEVNFKSIRMVCIPSFQIDLLEPNLVLLWCSSDCMCNPSHNRKIRWGERDCRFPFPHHIHPHLCVCVCVCVCVSGSVLALPPSDSDGTLVRHVLCCCETYSLPPSVILSSDTVPASSQQC